MSVQRSVFQLFGSIGVVGEETVVVPSGPRGMPKGARFLGAQFVLLPTDDPVFPADGGEFSVRLQGRNGPTDDDWVDVNGGDLSGNITSSGPVSQMFDGFDQLVRIEQFNEIRVVGDIEEDGDFDDVTFGVFFKTDYPTG